MSENRQLAIILFADIQGYTALMQKDEQLAAALLRRFHEELEAKINGHHGRIVNFYGDGALCIFQNPLEAIHAAMELQQVFQKTPMIPVRMGLHSGSVVIEGDKVFGDSINVASRIESMGTPGAILFSKRIRDEIKNQPGLTSISLGSFEFKNLDEPVELYALTNAGFIVPKRSEMEGKLKIPASQKTNSGKWLAALFIMAAVFVLVFIKFRGSADAANMTLPPSIAVLPFRNLSDDQSQNYFAEGIVETIQSKLSEAQSLKIISMSSTLNYRNHKKTNAEIAKELQVNNILEGSVLRDQKKVRIIVKLINTSTNEQLWTQTFDRDLTDIFAIQSSIAQSVTAALKAKLTDNEKGKLAKVHAGDLVAYDLYLNGLNDLRKARFDTVRNGLAQSKFQ
jgi:TolB-like protein